MLRFWRDGAERQLSALNAAIKTLQEQMDRDAQTPTDPCSTHERALETTLHPSLNGHRRNTELFRC